MKQNIFLVTFGLSIGLVFTWLCYPLFAHYANQFAASQLPEGSSFESIEDFHRAMLSRDDRDKKSDRSVSLRSIITPHTNHEIMYDLLPNLDVKFQGVPVRTNSCGFRGPEMNVEKPARTYRIAFLGDSFTFGWGVKEDESFVSQVGTILDSISDEVSVEVLNFGVPGYSTFQEVAHFLERGLDYQPDAVVVFFVENDFGLPFFISNFDKPGSIMTGLNFAKKASHGKDAALKKHARELRDQLSPNAAIIKLAKVLRSKGIELHLAINPRPGWRRDLRRLKPLVKNNWVNVIQMRGPFMRLFRERGLTAKSLSLATDPHPSPIKHRLLAEVISSALYPAFADYADYYENFVS